MYHNVFLWALLVCDSVSRNVSVRQRESKQTHSFEG